MFKFGDIFRKLPGGFATACDGVSGEGWGCSCEGYFSAGVRGGDGREDSLQLVHW